MVDSVLNFEMISISWSWSRSWKNYRIKIKFAEFLQYIKRIFGIEFRNDILILISFLILRKSLRVKTKFRGHLYNINHTWSKKAQERRSGTYWSIHLTSVLNFKVISLSWSSSCSWKNYRTKTKLAGYTKKRKPQLFIEFLVLSTIWRCNESLPNFSL